MSLDLASKLDTRIRIECKVVTHDPQYGTEQVTWTEFACVWAEVKDILPSKAERLADSIQIGRRPARIRIRYLAGQRIYWNLQNWDRTINNFFNNNSSNYC